MKGGAVHFVCKQCWKIYTAFVCLALVLLQMIIHVLGLARASSLFYSSFAGKIDKFNYGHKPNDMILIASTEFYLRYSDPSYFTVANAYGKCNFH